MTNLELVNYYKQYIGHEKYAKAMADYLLTESEINKQANRSGSVGDWYKKSNKINPNLTNQQYLMQFTDGKWYGGDCVCSIKGVLFYGNRYGGPDHNYNSNYDFSIKEMANACTDKKSKADIKKAEIGEFMWNEDYSHCALVSVNGSKDVECAPSLDGVAEVDLDYQPDWAGCGKLPWVTYVSDVNPSPVVIKAGDVVTIAQGAVYGGSDKGVKVPNKYCGVPYRVSRVQMVKEERCALIEELNSWVPCRYLTVVPQEEGIKKGSCVKILKGAVYGGADKGVPVPKIYINTNAYVSKVGTHGGVKEALLKNLNSWVPVKYLKLVR
ncbi:MAG: hypothetical protein J5617_04020 [Bacilli bacterium]|nr:hypothetical protein [Bacilli bacterium]